MDDETKVVDQVKEQPAQRQVTPKDAMLYTVVVPGSAVIVAGVFTAILTRLCGLKSCCCFPCVWGLKMAKRYRRTPNVTGFQSPTAALQSYWMATQVKSPRFESTADFSTTCGSQLGFALNSDHLAMSRQSADREFQHKTTEQHFQQSSQQHMEQLPAPSHYKAQIDRNFFNPTVRNANVRRPSGFNPFEGPSMGMTEQRVLIEALQNAQQLAKYKQFPGGG